MYSMHNAMRICHCEKKPRMKKQNTRLKLHVCRTTSCVTIVICLLVLCTGCTSAAKPPPAAFNADYVVATARSYDFVEDYTDDPALYIVEDPTLSQPSRNGISEATVHQYTHTLLAGPDAQEYIRIHMMDFEDEAAATKYFTRLQEVSVEKDDADTSEYYGYPARLYRLPGGNAAQTLAQDDKTIGYQFVYKNILLDVCHVRKIYKHSLAVSSSIETLATADFYADLFIPDEIIAQLTAH